MFNKNLYTKSNIHLFIVAEILYCWKGSYHISKEYPPIIYLLPNLNSILFFKCSCDRVCLKFSQQLNPIRNL